MLKTDNLGLGLVFR